ncbi:hypothetical protein ATCR1_21310 [Agrobacterium tumefaciens CCNWGS0286]|uniref:hypothetical protein n=1 Tax=Agrobacterium tumefaciens TaxID=358 RepID=UPI0002334BE7|nr:hypothetical protein [Agrobacterium tumefaciens]EHH03362.1 hypothetical protein ATCR1_21310 [Agrobacterium tumefaciens CCNWGS0286]
MTDTQIYTATDRYNRTVDQLEAIARDFDPERPDDLRTQIIEALGGLGIWPMSALAGHDEGEMFAVA